MSVNVNSIITNYANVSATQGDTLGNEAGVASISYQDGELLFVENDGDTIAMEAANLTDQDVEALAKELGATVATEEENAAAGTEAEGVDAEDGDLEANKAKLADLQAQWDNLNDSAETIKETVEKLSEEIKESLDAALEEQEQITKDEQKRIDEMVQQNIAQFKKDKENGKDVSLGDLQGQIKDGLSNSGFDEEMSSLVSDLVVTNAKMVQMDGLLTELGVINGQMKQLDTSITELEDTIEEQEKAAEEAANCNPCDPIGFKDEEGTTFEFVIDKDGNGELSNFSEFLGSENFFDEMVELDTDGSQNVTNEELEAAGVQVLVTNADGSQEMKSIEEAFGGEEVNVDLASYKEAEDGAVAENGQELLGNYDISIGDDTYEGYSTLDSAEYLLENYTFTDEDPAAAIAGNAAEGEEAAEGEVSERTLASEDIDSFIEEYTGKLEAFEEQFANVVELLGLDQELIETVQEFAETTGTAAAQSIINEIEAQQAEEAEAKEEENVDGVEGAEGAENEEAEEDEEEEKEAA